MQTRTKPWIAAGALALAVAAGSVFTGSAIATDRMVIVQPGDTLSGIALEQGMTVPQLVALNGIADPNRILAGQRLVVAWGATTPATAPAAATHRVAFGETLTGIAKRYGTTIAAIAAANGIVNPSLIRTGQLLAILAGTAPAAGGGPTAAMTALTATRFAQREGVRRLIVTEAVAQGVPPALALAVAWQESGWRQGVVSSAGAIGIMQLIPASGEWVAQAMLGEPVNLYDAASNVRAGVCLLRHYLDRYGGDRSLVLAAYYQGQTAVDHHGVYAVSRSYIESVLRLEQTFSR
jgi:soluble lytic murein transglycosylase-like protein